jgi:hypothetical protein
MFRFIFRWVFRLLVLAIILIVAGLLLKDTILKGIAERRIREETGLEVKIGKFEAGLMTPTVRIEDFVLYNKPEFGGGPMVDMPELYMEYDVQDMAQKKFHLKLMRINLREVNIVEGGGGQTNVFDLLKNFPMPDLSKPHTNRTEFGLIETLNLSLGKFKVTNLTNAALNQNIQIGLKNEVLRNVRSDEDLYGVMLKVMLRAGITIMNSPALQPQAKPPRTSPTPRRF